jgi:hypothetical protein
LFSRIRQKIFENQISLLDSKKRSEFSYSHLQFCSDCHKSQINQYQLNDRFFKSRESLDNNITLQYRPLVSRAQVFAWPTTFRWVQLRKIAAASVHVKTSSCFRLADDISMGATAQGRGSLCACEDKLLPLLGRRRFVGFICCSMADSAT